MLAHTIAHDTNSASNMMPQTRGYEKLKLTEYTIEPTSDVSFEVSAASKASASRPVV